MSTNKKYTFYSYPNNPRVFKSLIAAKYGGIYDDFEVVEVKLGTDNKTDDFLKLNPLGKVPTLKTPEGGVWESDAIARYVCRVGNASKQLLGDSPYEQSQVDRFIDLFTNTFMQNYYPTWGFAWGFIKYNAETRLKCVEVMQNFFSTCEKQLSHGKNFLFGDHVTLADILIATMMVPPITYSYDEELRKKNADFFKYLDRVYAEKNVHDVLGDIKKIEKFDATPYEK